MKKYVLHEIDAGSVAKIYLVFGVIFGILFGSVMLLAAIAENPDILLVAVFGGILMIFLYSLLGAAMAALFVWAYNQIAKRTGGISFYLKEEQHLTPAPIQPNSSEQNTTPDDPTLV